MMTFACVVSECQRRGRGVDIPWRFKTGEIQGTKLVAARKWTEWDAFCITLLALAPAATTAGRPTYHAYPWH